MALQNDPLDPAVWLERARGNLLLAERGLNFASIYLEDLCFNAQQAAEKALKAACIHYKIDVPKTHSLVRLMDLLGARDVQLPETVLAADILTQYAVETRYPGLGERITIPESGSGIR